MTHWDLSFWFLNTSNFWDTQNPRRTAQCYATVAAGCTLTGTCNGPDISPSNPVSYGIGASDSPACYVRVLPHSHQQCSRFAKLTIRISRSLVNNTEYGCDACVQPVVHLCGVCVQTLITRSSGGVVTVYRGHATTTCVNHCYSAMATHSAIVTGGGAIYYRWWTSAFFPPPSFLFFGFALISTSVNA